MRVLSVALVSACVFLGCAGTLGNRSTALCPAALSAPVLRVGDTWRWQDDKGAKWYRRYVRETDDGLLEAEGRTNAPRLFYDQAHTLRKVIVDEQEVTRESLDFAMLGKPPLEFPLAPGKTWNYLRHGRATIGNDLLTYRTTFAVQGCEQITVPAGTFLAVVITEEQAILGRVDRGWRTWWYAPEVKYFVKLTHGHASHPGFWASFRDWALTAYQIMPPPGGVLPPSSTGPSPAAPALQGADVVGPTIAPAPSWDLGHEWTFRWVSPRGSGTFVWTVAREEVVADIPQYVVKSGTREIVYRKADLAWMLERVGGAVDERSTPAERRFDWPLVVGKEWAETYAWENPSARSTETRQRRYRVEAMDVVTVPAGTFHTFRVSSKDPTGRLLNEYWYASEVKWFVKQRRFLSYGMEERELVEFKLPGPRAPAP